MIESNLAQGMVLFFTALLLIVLFLDGRRLTKNKIKGELEKVALAERIIQFHSIVSNATAAIFILHGERFIYANPATEEATGYSKEELMALDGLAHIHPDQREATRSRIAARNQGDPKAFRFELMLLTKGGETRWMNATARNILFDDQLRTIVSAFDITKRKQAEAALQDRESKYRFLTESMKDVVWTLDVETLMFTYVSPSVERLRGFTPEEVMASPLDHALTEGSAAHIRELLRQGLEIFEIREKYGASTYNTEEVEQTRKDGSTVWTEAVTYYWRNPTDGRIEIHGVSRDISERKEAEAKMAHMARHDPLTGLPNRALFSDRLERAIAMSKREGGRLALMFLDLDKFKPVNDTYGHGVGDLLLQKAARRMTSTVRESDTVGRIGGDEFVVLLPQVKTGEDGMVLAQRLLEAINRPFEIEGHTLQVSCSIGIAIFPDHGSEPMELAKNADTAMYWGKNKGGGTVSLYAPPTLEPPKEKEG